MSQQPLYIVYSDDVEPFTAWGLDGIKEGLEDLFGCDLVEFAENGVGNIDVTAHADFEGRFHLIAVLQHEIYGQKRSRAA